MTDEALAFPTARHDHAACIAEALDRAERLCAERGERLTTLRRQVLELVWSGHAPQGAYDLLEQLGQARGRVAPPTVYRALEFLQAQGLIHRIESLNAFIGCPIPEERHSGQFFICRLCGLAAELDVGAIDRAIDREATRLGFTIERRTVELQGLCRACREAQA
ncbi:Fur family transcriptional regulator, zinc uptake regulator [Tistlia consotensis]|uniref:Fur family transcriptional regulator, zinc uptake regulator n=1 Tax=Tistlia consotensis USBA 355 TaxID=560819 RepID=A0A1Y6C9Z5_9PROT|nr:transcriptional repressor [Tistlia consotensis]SMF53460.1 Fur family transcriptional regulator, zinc uptake regulator [Tistlia consotensis USBA 355]SNR85553.1 Fur family transcriptional regulator, zinc uptake regulator [Tistlia consotensis]